MAGLDAAVKAALKGPERKDIKIRKHDFNVKKASKKVVNGETHIAGQISHRVRWTPDDQVFYAIVLKDKKVTKVTRSIKGGGWGKMAGKLAAWIVGSDAATAEEIYEKVEGLVVGNWIEAADVIIGAVALEAV